MNKMTLFIPFNVVWWNIAHFKDEIDSICTVNSHYIQVLKHELTNSFLTQNKNRFQIIGVHIQWNCLIPFPLNIACFRTYSGRQERMMMSFFIAEGGGRVCNLQKFKQAESPVCTKNKNDVIMRSCGRPLGTSGKLNLLGYPHHFIMLTRKWRKKHQITNVHV